MAAQDTTQKGPDPTLVTLATWFLPGAGHLMLGKTKIALVAFVLIEGLYALGWILSDGRAFEFLDPELRGVFATLLSPEVGNLGAMIAQIKLRGFGPDLPAPFPSSVHLGSALAGLSGIANACLMVHVHLAARTPEPKRAGAQSPALLVAAGLAIPGFGHFLQGRKRRALVVFVLLCGLFVWGTWLSEGANLSRERHFYYWAGQFLIGLPAFLTEIVSGRPPVTGEMAHGDIGLLFACMPGLLNILALLDVYGVAEKRWHDQPDGVDEVEPAAAEVAS